MNNITTLQANNNRYLGQFLTDLPHNCLFNKGITGSGGTTIALNNDEDYLITVPFTNLIKNKCEQHSNVLGVYSGVTDSDIEEYLRNQTGPKKIMVTYDSIERVMKFINPTKYRLLIDESHKLIDSGSFRGKAIRAVISNYLSFKSYTFMTATPVKDKYQHPQLKELDKVNVKWDNIAPVNVNYQLLSGEFDRKIASMVVSYLTGETEGNPYLFINSVSSIIKIIRILKKLGYTDASLYKIIIADNEVNEEKLNSKLGSKFKIGKPSDTNKKITFITSTCFEGADFYDEEGVTYILTDGNRDHTKIDILTCLPQIVGRLRNSKYNGSVNVIFTKSPYFSYTTEDEFEKYIKSQLDEAKLFVNMLNDENTVTMIKQGLIAAAETNTFVIKEDCYKVNTEAMYSEMHNFESMHTTYYVNNQGNQHIKSEVKDINGTKYVYKPSTQSPDLTLADKIKLSDVKFTEMAKAYCEAKDTHTSLLTYNDVINSIENSNQYSVLSQAYTELGHDKIKALKYRKGAITKELLVQDKVKTSRYKVFKMLTNNLRVRVGSWVSCSDIKNELSIIYNTLGIETKAKSTDISMLYEVKSASRRVNVTGVNGSISKKKVAGFVIIMPLVSENS